MIILQAIFYIWAAGLALVFAIEYWRWVLFVIGIFLVNYFIYWSPFVIFTLAIFAGSYEAHKAKKLNRDYILQTVVPESFKGTIGLIIIALALKYLFLFFAGASPCESNPMSRYC